MNKVAKYETWCELQYPVNHRVFERKLRHEPFSQAHICLGVTHYCLHYTTFPIRDRCKGTRLDLDVASMDSYTTLRMLTPKRTTFSMCPQVRRDYLLSLSISISGGKETYKDSLSNGERIGKSPT
ncbi:hypothetical protein E5676_scaffold436G00770 [Cucumis melo var. makuwa]|uniref:Uncharacterized protein n=1 Tax=Cucumis melo var. makuwa TaxID=1194695 RepID=A0A5D3DQC0_CUCMM|nr:hypothetical protein E5676_scaffold436G00770 [Cucumis melo var. makuwa]